MLLLAVLEAYRDFYRGEPFVRVHDSGAALGTIHVRGTNRCNLVVGVDERAGRFRVVSYIDNLMKGQAGSALQNMNLLFGLPETAGLERSPELIYGLLLVTNVMESVYHDDAGERSIGER